MIYNCQAKPLTKHCYRHKVVLQKLFLVKGFTMFDYFLCLQNATSRRNIINGLFFTCHLQKQNISNSNVN